MTQSAAAVAPTGTQSSELVDLVLRARSGERQAYGDLVELYWSDLVSLARGILAADEEAEDLVQDALVHAWQRLWTLRRPERFAEWMRRIVARRCITWARRRRRHQELPDLPTSQPAVGAGLDATRLLATVAPRQRAALYLTWIEGCTAQEAGRILGVSAATVRVHRHRALQHLRRMVEERP